MGESKETSQPLDALSALELKTVKTLNQPIPLAMKSNISKLSENINTKKYLENVTTTIHDFTDRPKKIPYGTGPGKLVCDQFVKAVLTKIETKQENKDTINSIAGTVRMFNKIRPTKTLAFSGTQLSKLPPVGALLFFVDDNKSCGHVGFFTGIENGVPMIADANQKKGVTKRQLWPAEASKIYYEENYREKFLKKA